MAPEYAMRGYLTEKADVYSFGIVVLEIVSGRSNTNYKPREDFVYLLYWVTPEFSSIHKRQFRPCWVGACFVITLDNRPCLVELHSKLLQKRFYEALPNG